ncbi:MAG: sugar-binding transcriptional regulator [Chloroflexi bacterium]|nr:sugar-binding transcriptional regulator [Chloroflexota bacterium]
MAVPDDSDDLLASAARMYYLDQLDQREIGDLLGVSRSTVSRLLKSARDRGLVQISVSPYDPRDRQREAALQDRFGVRHAVVIRTTGRSAANVGRTVGYFAAAAASELIGAGATVGVSGGRTLAALVSFMAPAEAAQHVTILPMMGNIGPQTTAIDGLEISRELARRLQGAFYTVNAPAVVQDRQARDMLLAHAHIRLVWELFDTLTLAFVGIGTLADSIFVEQGVFRPAELADLGRSGVVGEICGRFFDRDGRECATEYRDRVLSIDLDVLRRCAHVVGVTNGPRRAAAVHAALRGGLIASLVIDDVGADAVLALSDDA